MGKKSKINNENKRLGLSQALRIFSQEKASENGSLQVPSQAFPVPHWRCMYIRGLWGPSEPLKLSRVGLSDGGGGGECFKSVTAVASFLSSFLLSFSSSSFSFISIPSSARIAFPETGSSRGPECSAWLWPKCGCRWAIFSKTSKSSLRQVLSCCVVEDHRANQECLDWRIRAFENLWVDEVAGDRRQVPDTST